MTMKHPVTALLSLPGYRHNFELHGRPQASDTYLRSGHPAVDLILGDPLEGAVGRPKLTVETQAELEELEFAVQQMRARWSLWFADHQGDVA
jgi:hypothetical protein